jgi:hypothetical protein
MFAILESNGLGDLMLAAFGSDVTSAQLGTSGAYDHVFTMTDTPLTMTVWCWDTLDPQDIRMVVVDSMKIEVNKEKNEILFTFDCVGSDMASSATFGSASYIDTATHKPNVIPASQALLEFGEPAANIRQAWESAVFQVKNAAKFGAPGKAPVPSGSSSPQLVSWSNQDVTIDIEFIDQDGKELKRWRQGGDVAPTASAQTDTQALTKFRLRAFGSAIGTTAIWGYSDLNKAGAATCTWGGTFSGTGPDMFEVKITTDGTPDKFMWRKNGGAWSAEVEVTGAAQTLSDGVTVTFSSTTTSTLGDRHYGFSHYQRMISIESLYNVIEKVAPKDSDDFYRGTINMYHSSGPSATKPTVTFRNNKTTAYP